MKLRNVTFDEVKNGEVHFDLSNNSRTIRTDSPEFASLQDSIRHHGVLVPASGVISAETPSVIGLDDGGMRFKAWQAVSEDIAANGGKPKDFPVLVKEVKKEKPKDSLNRLRVSAHMNKRVSVSVPNQAILVKTLLSRGATLKMIANDLGYTQSRISQLAKLADSAPEILAAVEQKWITEHDARILNDLSYEDVTGLLEAANGSVLEEIDTTPILNATIAAQEDMEARMRGEAPPPPEEHTQARIQIGPASGAALTAALANEGQKTVDAAAIAAKLREEKAKAAASAPRRITINTVRDQLRHAVEKTVITVSGKQAVTLALKLAAGEIDEQAFLYALEGREEAMTAKAA